MPELSKLSQKLDDHIKDDDRRFEYMENHIINTRDDIKKIKDNHLAHVQADVAELRTSIATVKTDVSWLKKNQWWIMTTSVGTLITVLAGVIMMFLKLK